MSEADDLKQYLSDPEWRMFSGKLYKIMVKEDENDEGLVVSFIPNEVQRLFLRDFHNRNIILKARQLGFSTLIAIYMLDCALFRKNVRAGIIAQTEEHAKGIFRDKVQFAYLNLPEQLRNAMPLARDSQSELLFEHNNSSIRVATSMRSGTLHYLHVSEFGQICKQFPERANEVVTGSLPAVPQSGIAFIESTARGQEGEFYEMCQRSLKLKEAGKKLSKKDFQFNFYPWWIAKEYRSDPSGVLVTEDDNKYFDGIEVSEVCTIDAEQRAWWCATRDSDFSGTTETMWQEYPSTPKEAFQQSTEGCYYTVQLTSARKQGRITSVPHRQGSLVNTFWDIGRGDGTGIWLHQQIGQYDNWIGYIEGWDEPYSYYVSEMQKLGYVWGAHYLPHDGNHRRQGQDDSLSPKEMLENLGLKNVEVVPPVADLSHGIQATRDAFSTFWFDEAACKKGIRHLEGYRKQWSKTNGRFMDSPVKNEHREAADAIRQFAQGYEPERDAPDYDIPVRQYAGGGGAWMT